MRPGDHNPYEPGPHNQRLASTSYDPIVVARQGAMPVEWLGAQIAADDEQGFNVLDFWHLVLKHQMMVAGAVIIALAIGIAYTLLATPIYTATMTLQIDRAAAKVVDVEGITPAELASGEEFFQTQYGLLKSTSLATRVVDDLGLAKEGFFKTMGAAAPKVEGKARQVAMRRKAAELVRENLNVQPVRGSRLVKVSFDSPSPQLSARVANGVADSFIDSNLERRYESASYARNFLEQRLRQVKVRLEDSEKQLVAYASSQQIINVSVAPSGASGGAEETASQSLTAADLVGMNSALAIAKADRIRAEERWRQAQRGNAASISEVLQSPTIQALRQQKATLSAQYQDKLSLYKPDFPVMVQLKAQMTETDRQIADETETIRRSLQGQYQIAAQQEASLARQVASLKVGVMDLRNRSIQYNILQREVDTNRTLYDGLLQRYKEVGIAGGVGSNNISVVDRAEPPVAPSRPKPVLNLAIAVMLGLLLGMLAALVVELMDESIRSPEDIETKLGIPLLGAIPLLPRNVMLEDAFADPKSAMSEAYHSVRTALQFSTPSGAPDVMLVTSTKPAEGKSTTSRSIAFGFARLGMRVLLIDGDLRNPSLHRMMGVDNSAGLSNLLAGICRLPDVVHPSAIPSLSFIPCGPLPPNPAELLSGTRLRTILAEARNHYDLIVLDGPPVMGLADAPLLAHVASGVLLVVEAAGTRRGQAMAALRRLNQGGRGKVLGAILTKFDAKQMSYGTGYNYAYDYDYGARPQLGRQTDIA